MSYLCVVVKHLTRSDGFNYEAVNVKFYECVCVLALVIRHATRIFSTLFHGKTEMNIICLYFDFLYNVCLKYF
jgi:hypothetical protein